jgi:hypothetical protein
MRKPRLLVQANELKPTFIRYDGICKTRKYQPDQWSVVERISGRVLGTIVYTGTLFTSHYLAEMPDGRRLWNITMLARAAGWIRENDRGSLVPPAQAIPVSDPPVVVDVPASRD